MSSDQETPIANRADARAAFAAGTAAFEEKFAGVSAGLDDDIHDALLVTALGNEPDVTNRLKEVDNSGSGMFPIHAVFNIADKTHLERAGGDPPTYKKVSEGLDHMRARVSVLDSDLFGSYLNRPLTPQETDICREALNAPLDAAENAFRKTSHAFKVLREQADRSRGGPDTPPI